MRKCRVCGQYKEDELFVKDKYIKGGIRNICYNCNKEQARARRKKLSNLLVENERLKENIRDIFNTNDIIDERMDKLKGENKSLQEKLDIAVKALEFYKKPFYQFNPTYNVAQHHKRADEALEKIKEIK